MIFNDRKEAGQKLVPLLKKYKNNPKAVILGLPRGGLVVAFEISQALNLPLDLVVPRKIGALGNPEFAIGAISEEGEAILNSEIISAAQISQSYLDLEIKKEKKEAQRRLQKYRKERPLLNLKGKIALLVDDGIATGNTMRAAIQSAKAKGSRKIVVVVPVCARDSFEIIKKEVDEIHCLDQPVFFGAVGAFYRVFPQTEDEEVIKIMEKSKNFKTKT
jgi:predicted phosphoribosyltransferase